MACPAIVAFHIISGAYPGRSGLHAKSKFDMAEPAGIFGSMEPVIEHDRGHIRFLRKVVHDNLPVIMRQRPFLLYPILRGNKSNAERTDHQKAYNKHIFFHKTLLSNSSNVS
jgi:hypothetical protein